MKITLVRHGQTEQNYQNILNGRSNDLLNDTGRRQCQKLREQLKDVHFDFCYMSPLVRTVETAFILKYWDYDLNSSDLGVEAIQDVFKRCEDFLEYVIKKHRGEHILVVSHGAPVRALYHLIKHHNLHGNLLTVSIPNCYCETFEIKE